MELRKNLVFKKQKKDFLNEPPRVSRDMSLEIERISAMVSDFNKKNYGCLIEVFVRREDKFSMSLESIMQAVCDRMGTSPDYIAMDCREEEIKIPRQMCHYMAYHRSKRSLKDIGFYFGRKNHSTVINSRRNIQDRLDTDKQFREQYYEFLTGYNVPKHIK
jgi:chromosomal replication initiation ATPase DnaA